MGWQQMVWRVCCAEAKTDSEGNITDSMHDAMPGNAVQGLYYEPDVPDVEHPDQDRHASTSKPVTIL